MGSLIHTKSNAELMAEEAAQAKAALPVEEDKFNSNLVNFIQKAWERAVKAKTDIAKQMIANMRQRNAEYDPEKLAQIKNVGVGAEVFMDITGTKCRAGEAWIREILFPPGQKPWAIEPTPIPELPKDLEAHLRQTFVEEAINQMTMRLTAQGLIPNPKMIAMFIADNKEVIDALINKVFEDEAHKRCDEMQKRIDDQLTEGGWYKALNDSVFDIVTLKAGIVKGPINRMEKARKVVNKNGKLSLSYEDRTIPQYDRISPFDIFPAPNSTGVNDGYLIERIPLRRDQIAALLKMPPDSGFIESEIRAVLQEYSNGGLRVWTEIDQEKEVLENRDTDVHDSDKIDCIQYWGPVQGKILKQFGGKMAKIVKDEDLDYNIIANMIGTHIIQAIENEDPMGCKDYSVTTYEKVPGSFWGKGVPELIADCNQMCNAAARAILNNVAIASGPQVERNIDRIPEGENKKIYPWKVWDSTNDMMSGNSPALTFYMPPMVVEKLIVVYDKFSKIADEHSGIPAYAHGDSQVGGAGNTASGLGMLMTSAARGIKNVVKSIDDDIITTTVERQYYRNIEKEEFRSLVGDMKVVAKGTSALIAKEQQALRINEFARTTANPIDFGIMGQDGRRYILERSAKALDLEVEKAVPKNFGPMSPLSPVQGNPQQPPQQQLPAPQNPGGATPLPAPQSIDQAGNPTQGKDFQLFEGGPTNA